jgi:hypothetical protein
VKARAATLLLLFAGCGRGEEPASSGAGREREPGLVRLLAAGRWRRDGVALAPAELAVAEVGGAARPAWIVEDGATLECDAALPREASWLDVEAAALPVAGETRPPPPVRLTARVRAGAFEATLHDGIPSAGTPPTAFGFGAARLELVAPQLLAGGDATFTFRIECTERSPSRRVALASPRIAPRATAADRPRLRVELHARAPDEAALAAAGAKERWPAFADLLGDGARWESPPFAGPSEEALLVGPADEVEWFGPVVESTKESGAARFDSAERCDPWRFALDDPLVVAHAGWDEALLRDRFRALGEHRLFRELARPRRGGLEVVVATRVEGAELDRALGRLVAHLRANELWDGTELVVAPLAAEGASPSRPWLRRPRRNR